MMIDAVEMCKYYSITFCAAMEMSFLEYFSSYYEVEFVQYGRLSGTDHRCIVLFVYLSWN